MLGMANVFLCVLGYLAYIFLYNFQTCRCCGEEAGIALKKCKLCGEEFPKKEKDWASIKKLKTLNSTVQHDLLERRVLMIQILLL